MAFPTNAKRNFTDDEEDSELRRGPWTLEEDTLLIHYIACHGEGRWDMLAKCSGLKRTGKSCRLRWLNYLKPDVKRGNLSLEEQIIILELHSKWGNRWSRIAQHLPGRTDNEIKNYWRTRVQKQARQLKVDANSKKFQETIRSFWMPRLLQKIEESSHSSFSSSSTTSTSYDCQNMKSQTSAAPLLVNQSPGAPEATKEPIGYYNIEQESNPNSMNIISQFSEISGYPVSPNAFGSNFYSMEAFSMDQQMSAMESSISDCPSLEDSHWMNHEVSLWNMDELWQFRKVQEKGI